ncbi:MAG: zinc ribbon domain-containing protein, partial [Candidatus Heimdallarchaeaceae archaeon]
MAFNWEPTFYLLGIIFITTALFAIIIGITAKKIDFSDRLFSLKDRKTLLPRRPVRDKALATFADFEETEGIKMKRKEKSRRAKKSLPSPRPSSSKRMRDVEPIKDEEYYEEMSDRATLAGREHAPKYDDEAEEVEMLKEEADEVEMLGEREESAKYLCPNCGTSLEQGVKFCANCGKSIQEVFEGFSRDLSIMIPKNMCLDEVFRLKITLIRDEQFD